MDKANLSRRLEFPSLYHGQSKCPKATTEARLRFQSDDLNKAKVPWHVAVSLSVLWTKQRFLGFLEFHYLYHEQGKVSKALRSFLVCTVEKAKVSRLVDVSLFVLRRR